MREEKLRREIVETAVKLDALGLNRGASGNVSARMGKGFLITPSGLACGEMGPGDIVGVSFEGRAKGKHKPSTEWRFHRDIFIERREVGAVVHAHAMFATTLACMGRDIPPFHYMIAVAGGSTIRCAPYATFGSQRLSNNALRALKDRRACLLANHGMICIGKTLKAALALALEVETLAAQYWRALQIGEPKLLSDKEMARVLKKFESYGAG